MESNIKIIDCVEKNIFPANLKNSKILEMIKDKKYEKIILKSALMNKTYDSSKNLKSITPFFSDVTLYSKSSDSKIIHSYTLKTGAKVSITMNEDKTQYIYNLSIPELKISYVELAKLKEKILKFQETGVGDGEIIARWYKGYGILEHILSDENVLEANINPPAHKTSIRIIHAKYQECRSNIYVDDTFLQFLATRLKMSTGRPVNKSQPQIDGEIYMGSTKARVAGIIDPFSIFGIGFSIRKHRDRPWTLPLFIKKKSVNSHFSGFMNLIISQGRSLLTAGPRGSGKTSLLGSLMLELLQRYRIITIEDTQELPIEDYKTLGYDILPLKVRSALIEDSIEIPFDKGLRTSLRLGDSAIIVGEVRSVEAKVLYEAMRVGAMSNVVAGTIHADNPYGVYDRVVNDLGVPKGSFKSTDIIIIQNLIKDPSGLSRKRRVVSVTEVTKDWEDEPVFQDLFLYNPSTDELEPTNFLMKGKSVTIKSIMQRSSGYKTYDDVLLDIKLRSWLKKIHVDLAKDDEDLLEAIYVNKLNSLYMRSIKELDPIQQKNNLEKFKQRILTEAKLILTKK